MAPNDGDIGKCYGLSSPCRNASYGAAVEVQGSEVAEGFTRSSKEPRSGPNRSGRGVLGVHRGKPCRQW